MHRVRAGVAQPPGVHQHCAAVGQPCSGVCTVGVTPPKRKAKVSMLWIATCQHAGHAKLSQERSEAVVAYLVGKGVAAERLSAKGWGEEKPVGSDDTDEGKAANRRVEFIIVKK